MPFSTFGASGSLTAKSTDVFTPIFCGLGCGVVAADVAESAGDGDSLLAGAGVSVLSSSEISTLVATNDGLLLVSDVSGDVSLASYFLAAEST